MTKPIGEILIEQGAITVEQLTQALAHQHHDKQKRRVGEVLVDMGIITETDIVVALSIQFGFPYLAPKSILLNRDVCNLVSRDLIRRHCFIPVDKVNHILYIVMADPSDEKAITEIEKSTQCKVQTFIATTSEIQDVILQQYGDK